VTLLRRWWRRFTARLHDHSDADCPHCISMITEGYTLRVNDEKLRRRDEGIERIVRAGFPRQDGGR